MENIDLHEAYRYCREHIELFDAKEAVALGYIDRMRCPLDFADERLYDEMSDALADYFEEKDLNLDELIEQGLVDIEDVFWAGEE